MTKTHAVFLSPTWANLMHLHIQDYLVSDGAHKIIYAETVDYTQWFITLVAVCKETKFKAKLVIPVSEILLVISGGD